ncbi:DUF3093 domain-containing protein [Okibacterium endophyticum]
MLAPISFLAGIITAAVLYGGIVAMLLLSSPVISVADGALNAGRARIPLDLVGEVTPYRGDDAFAERGPRLDARAWLLVRGWVKPVVRVTIEDRTDPTPYWLLSTRRPDDLVAAIEGSRRRGEMNSDG